MPSSRYNFKIGQRPPIFTMGLVRVKSAYIREIFATCDFSPQKPLDIEYQPLNWYPTDRYLSNKNGHFFSIFRKILILFLNRKNYLPWFEHINNVIQAPSDNNLIVYRHEFISRKDFIYFYDL